MSHGWCNGKQMYDVTQDRCHMDGVLENKCMMLQYEDGMLY